MKAIQYWPSRYEGNIRFVPKAYSPEGFNFQHTTVWNEKEACLMSQRELPLYRDFIYSLLQECTHRRDLAAARHAHSLMVRSGLDTVAVLGDHLIRAFTSCGCLIEAKEAFYRIPNPSVYTWNAIISAHAQLGECETAVHIYHQHMQQQGIKPDRVTFLSLLKACSGLRTAKQGMVIHHHIILDGFESERVIGNTSIDMYAKCGSVDEARKVFDLMAGRRNEVSWQALLVGYVQHDLVTPALELLKAMLLEGVTPSKVMFLCTLKACASRGAIDNGRRLHEQIKNCRLEADVVIGSTLLDMYSKCGSLQEACKVFDELPCRNVVTWGAMIAAQVRHGHSLAALELFEKMQQESIKPDEAVFSCILKACGSLRAMEQGKSVHEQISSSGLHGDVVLGNTLIDMYAKCGSMEEARKVFDKLQGRDVVSWGTMITGYVQHEHPLAALQLFEKMQDKGIQTSKIIYVGILKACSSIGAISQGRLMHDNVIKNCGDYDVVIDNSLLDMYAKCGSLGEARRVLDTVPTPDIVSWGSMIAGCAQHGDVCMARQCLEDMHQQGLKPDVAISTSVLVASSHTGLVEEGHWHLTHKMNELCLASDAEHFNSRIDLLGRAGFLEEADILIRSLPILPDTVGWRSLLSGCRTYGNMQLGRKCFDELVKLNPIDASGLVLMSNIFADAHLWEDADTLRERRKSMGAWKRPGKAWIEVDNVVHEFIVGGTVHPQSESIHVKSCRLSKYIKEGGHLLLLE